MVLDGREGRRPRQIAQAACDDPDPAVAAAAIAVLRGWVAREDGTESLDLLSRVALDANRDDRVRLAALDALSELPADIVRPLLQQMPASLRPEAHPVVALDTVDDPLAMSDWITAHRRAPLSALHAAVVRIREREQADPPAPIRQAWVTARGSAHAALAARDSRVALYDLRESFDTATHPLPPDFLTAMTAIGDATCLDAVAHAWSASPDEVWWRGQLCDVAAAILKRDKLTGRHATVKRLKAKYPGFA
jgi:hypothetical protein